MRFYFATFVTIFLGVGLANLIADPTGARINYAHDLPIPAGYFYTGNNINERVLKKYMLAADHTSTVFILGTSRVLVGWNLALIPGEKKVLDLGVTSATVEDYMYFLGQLRERPQVNEVLIEIAANTFHSSPADERSEIYDKIDTLRGRYADYKDLFTIVMLRESVSSHLHSQSIGKIVPLQGNESAYGLNRDGTRHLSAAYLQTPAREAEAKARAEIETPGHDGMTDGIDSQKVERFCASLNDLKHKSNTQIHLFVLPFNPAAARHLKNLNLGYSVEDSNRAAILAVEKTCGLSVQNYDDLCPAEEFYDADHFREACFARLVRRWKTENIL